MKQLEQKTSGLDELLTAFSEDCEALQNEKNSSSRPQQIHAFAREQHSFKLLTHLLLAVIRTTEGLHNSAASTDSLMSRRPDTASPALFMLASFLFVGGGKSQQVLPRCRFRQLSYQSTPTMKASSYYDFPDSDTLHGDLDPCITPVINQQAMILAHHAHGVQRTVRLMSTSQATREHTTPNKIAEACYVKRGGTSEYRYALV